MEPLRGAENIEFEQWEEVEEKVRQDAFICNPTPTTPTLSRTRRLVLAAA
jgi:hypothetical protein